MTSEEAKRILLLYRGHAAAEGDGEMGQALEQARRDPELQQWFDQHRRVQAAIQQKFREVPVPPQLKEAILAGRKIVRPVFGWHQPAWLAAAAAVALLVGAGAFWLRPDSTQRFALYRARMVRLALHEYRMDIKTNDLREVRRYLAVKGGPADFGIPKRLEQLNVTGGGHIRWSKAPASMICFDRGDRQMLFLFVISPDAVKGEPSDAVQVKIGDLQTVSWTEGTNTYVLAGPDDPVFAEKYGPNGY